MVILLAWILEANCEGRSTHNMKKENNTSGAEAPFLHNVKGMARRPNEGGAPSEIEKNES
jgi:hypothetical protein